MTNEEAIKIIDKGLDIGDQMPFLTVEQMNEAKQMAIKALEQQTEYHGTEDMDGLYYCPICQQTTTVVKDGKCPKCGATMDELLTREQTLVNRKDAECAVYETAISFNRRIRKPVLDEILLKSIKKIEDLPSVTPKPCEDAISRKQAVYIASGFCHPANVADELAKLPSVNPQPKTGHCKDCKYFEYNSVAKVDGIPLIVAHEICKRWGDGCKTSENGYCFLFEPQESEGV